MGTKKPPKQKTKSAPKKKLKPRDGATWLTIWSRSSQLLPLVTRRSKAHLPALSLPP